MTSIAPWVSASRKRSRAVLRCALFCISGTIHALLDPLADQLLGLERRLVLFLQMSQQCFPLAQLGIAQHRVLDHLVALVFGSAAWPRSNQSWRRAQNRAAAGLKSVDWLLKLTIEGAEPSRLNGYPHDFPSPEPTMNCGIYWFRASR